MRRLFFGIFLLILLVWSVGYLPAGVMSRGALVAGVLLILWLLELVPIYIPTVILWLIVPWVVRIPGAGWGEALGWSADPVLLLFFGGLALSVAAAKTGWDARMVQVAIRFSRGNRRRLLVGTVVATAFCSMWISGIAGAALMLVALRPILSRGALEDSFRRALLVGVAFGANFGGMATPIGAGPNAIAIAALETRAPMTFLEWMSVGVPLTGVMLLALLLFLIFRYRISGSFEIPQIASSPLDREGRGVGIIFGLMVVGWLTESWHGISSSMVALIGVVLLFGSRLLRAKDLMRIDWGTLLLIAGGLALGRLLDQCGLLALVAENISWMNLTPFEGALFMAGGSAGLSALMSNTAAATMLVPLALAFDPGRGGPVLVALSSSLGVPLVISTPANALVYGEKGLRASDFLVPGLILMTLGVLGMAWVFC